MLKSMTAYGRATVTLPAGRITVEITSVNRKLLEVTAVLPPELQRYDIAIKKKVGKRVSRGHLIVRVTVAYEEEHPFDVVPNIALAKKIQKGWQQLSQALELPSDEVGLAAWLKQEPSLLLCVPSQQNEEQWQHAVVEAVGKAIDQLDTMKGVEGEYLQKDISSRLHAIKELMVGVEAEAGNVVEHYRKKIAARLQSCGVDTDGEALQQEMCLFAERADISEEVTRLSAHLTELQILLEQPQQARGKKIEFFIQELQREMGTIAAKGQAVAISHASVAMRVELEKIREQVHNVE